MIFFILYIFVFVNVFDDWSQVPELLIQVQVYLTEEGHGLGHIRVVCSFAGISSAPLVSSALVRFYSSVNHCFGGKKNILDS